jgi:hypothetical protein
MRDAELKRVSRTRRSLETLNIFTNILFLLIIIFSNVYLVVVVLVFLYFVVSCFVMFFEVKIE